jgi:hypothetical protein
MGGRGNGGEERKKCVKNKKIKLSQINRRSFKNKM